MEGGCQENILTRDETGSNNVKLILFSKPETGKRGYL